MIGGSSGIAGIRSGSGPSSGSLFRLVTGALGRGAPASVAGIDDAGGLTATSAAGAAVVFIPVGDGSPVVSPRNRSPLHRTRRSEGRGREPVPASRRVAPQGAGDGGGLGCDAARAVGTWFSTGGVAARAAAATSLARRCPHRLYR